MGFFELISRLWRFALVNSGALIIDFGILTLLTEIFHVYYLISASISFLSSASVSYFVNRKLSFKDTKESVVFAYFKFLMFSMIGLSLTLGMMWLLVSHFHFNYLIARLIVAVIEGSISFVLHTLYTFEVPLLRFRK